MTPQQLKAMKLALGALEDSPMSRKNKDAIDALRETLAQPEQALCDLAEDGVCETLDCPNHPSQRKPLSDKAITQVIDSMPKKIKGFMFDWDLYEFTRAIEAKLKENT